MDISKLAGIIPDDIIAQLPALSKYGIDGPKRLSHLLGQAMQESDIFKAMIENLNYSAEALIKIFPKHFTGIGDATNYTRQPEKIANRIYCNRMGNGNENSGDGWKYRGRGALQTTGKDAYQQLTDAVGIEGVDFVENPDLVTPDYCMASAAIFFERNGLWPICDHGVDNDTITTITKHVNGGILGLDNRIKYTQQVYAALTD